MLAPFKVADASNRLIVLLPEWEGIRATPDTETLENNCGPETTILQYVIS